VTGYTTKAFHVFAQPANPLKEVKGGTHSIMR